MELPKWKLQPAEVAAASRKNPSVVIWRYMLFPTGKLAYRFSKPARTVHSPRATPQRTRGIPSVERDRASGGREPALITLGAGARRPSQPTWNSM